MKKEIVLPDIAENVDSGLIAGILVAEGDEVTEEQPLVEVETDKATTEIPSDFDGVVREIRVKEGDEVKVNQVILVLEVEDKNGSDKKSGESKPEKNSGTNENKTEKSGNDSPTEEQSYNGRSSKQSAGKNGSDRDKEEQAKGNKGIENDKKEQTPASPLARRIARENQVDLRDIEPSGPSNRISKDDVEQYVRHREEEDKEASTAEDSRVREEYMNNIARVTAHTMREAWQTIPHVTQHDQADLSDLEEYRKKMNSRFAEQGVKLTVTSILCKITAFALQKFPKFNASLVEEENKIHYRDQYNIGIAVDTEQGLLVPVIKDVNHKSLSDISKEIAELAKRARNKELSADEMKGGTFTLSNLGGIGGTAFTPIVYPPQVAILGVSEASFKQIIVNEEFKKRLILPLSLSYDHRVINGADGARFLRWIGKVIENPYNLLFW